jgi:hypothetical protein
MKRIYYLSFFVFLLSGCESGLDSEQVQSVPEFSQPSSEAIQDLSGRLGIQSGEIKVVSEKNVTWRDGSLGCPKPGMMYTQALVEGTLIVLRVDDTKYEYHSGGGRAPFYCENPVSPAAAKPSLD